MHYGSYAFGVFTGAIIGIMAISYFTTPNIKLHAVGIDHIEHCHNVHSNWCEIVWIKDVK